MRQKIIYYGAFLANILLIVFALFIFADSYGREKIFALLFCIPAILSIMTIFQGQDLEERRLLKRIRKANMRKELKALSEFDT